MRSLWRVCPLTVSSPGLVFIFDNNLPETGREPMAIVIDHSLADMLSCLSNQIFQFLPATMARDLQFVSQLERRTSGSNNHLRGYTLHLLGRRQIHHLIFAILDCGPFLGQKVACLATRSLGSYRFGGSSVRSENGRYFEAFRCLT